MTSNRESPRLGAHAAPTSGEPSRIGPSPSCLSPSPLLPCFSPSFLPIHPSPYPSSDLVLPSLSLSNSLFQLLVTPAPRFLSLPLTPSNNLHPYLLAPPLTTPLSHPPPSPGPGLRRWANMAAAVGRDTLPEHWSYGVCRDGRVFFIKCVRGGDTRAGSYPGAGAASGRVGRRR